MILEAEDFRAESRALASILDPISEQDFQQSTQFKSWTINDVLGHLHMFNVAADLSLEGGAKYDAFAIELMAAFQSGKTILQSQYPFLDGLEGKALLAAWKNGYEATADRFAQADPKVRLKWLGPDMSARSSITARQMETWAHGQEVFDLLGVVRTDEDRIKNIVHLGVNTFGWAFHNRGQKVPDPQPYVNLVAPSGVTWEWNDLQADNAVSGSAVEFAQVVTQVRNVEDTALVTTGDVAATWMAIAQCFAGPPETPPAKATRFLTG